MGKNIFKYTLIAAVTVSCVDLNLNPLSEASSENWYADAEEVTISLNDLYRQYLYGIELEYWTDRRTDDWHQRDFLYDIPSGTLTSTWGYSKTYWLNTYKGISRTNRIDESLDRLKGKETESTIERLRAEARLFRAYFYGRMVTCFGDVPFYLDYLTIEDAMKMGRTDKKVVLEQVWKDYDYAAKYLPVDNNGDGIWRVDKGTALALKARQAIYESEWEMCKEACEECMALGKYALFEDYGQLFREKGMTCETIFALMRSFSLDKSGCQSIASWLPRTVGGTQNAQPSWELLAAYECTDGKPIDESPLFDPKDPYKNRDPRCCEMFVAPGTQIFNIIFDPDPTSSTVLDVKTGKIVSNLDCKTVDQYAAYTSTCLKKGAQMDWVENLYNENPNIIIRYADVLLMYAEAKIELGQIDNTVLNAINDVRARAYKTTRDHTDKYPAITTVDRDELRLIVRKERRVEFPWEGRRYWDLLRWRWFDKALGAGKDMYGHLNPGSILEYYDNGNWYWPYAPDIDEYGFPDFTRMFDEGYIARYGIRNWDDKQYLWPVPNDEIVTNKNLTQNEGY